MGKHPTVTLSPFERALNRVPSLPAKDAKIIEAGLLWILERKREVERERVSPDCICDAAARAVVRERIAAAVEKRLAADRARIGTAIRKEAKERPFYPADVVLASLLRVVEGG